MPLEEAGVSLIAEGGSEFEGTLRGANEAMESFGGVAESVGSGIDMVSEVITGALRAVGEIAVTSLLAAGSAVMDFIGDSFAGALEAEQTMARLGQVIESTGGIAGVTVGEAEALADEFKNLAGGSDDAIISIIDMGLRMGTISEEEMPAFIQTTLDLGTVMGDNGKAAQTMARMHEDPIGTLGVLRKAGILVSEEMEAQAKAMVATGDTAGAYSLLMGRVEEATAGAAETMALTTAGQWAIFQETIADAGESIVGAFLPALNGIMTNLAPLIPLISDFAGIITTSFGNLINGNIRAGLEGLGESLFEIFPPEIAGPLNDALTWLSTNLQTFVAFIQSNLPAMQATFTTVFGSLQEMFTAVSGFITGTLLPAFSTIWGETGIQLPTMQQTFETVMATIASVMTLVTDFITNTLIPALTTAVEWVVANWPSIQAKIEEFWAVAQPILQQAADFVVNTLIPKFQEVVAWVITNWPMIQAKIEEVMGKIQEVVNTVINEVVPFIVEKFTEIKAWVDENWPLIQATIETIINNISENIHNVIDPLVAFWNENHETIKATADTIWENIKLIIDNAILTIEGIIKTTMQIITGDWAGAWETIKTTLSAIWENIKEIAGNNMDLLKGIVEDKIAELKTWWDAKWKEIQDSVTNILVNIVIGIQTKIEEIKSAFTNVDWVGIGTNIINSIKDGIGNAIGGLIDQARSAATDSYNAIIGALRGGSPMQLLVDAGGNIMGSMSMGIEAGVSDTVNAAQNAAVAVGNVFIDTNAQIGDTAGAAFVDSYAYQVSTLNSIMIGVQTSANNALVSASNTYASTIDALYASLGGSGSYSSPPPMGGTPPPMTVPPNAFGGGPVHGPPMPTPMPSPGVGPSTGGTGVTINLDARGASPSETQRAVGQALQTAGQYSDVRLRMRGAM